MPKTYVIFFAIGALIALFWAFPSKVKTTETSKVQIEKVEEQKHTRKIVTITEHPNGTKKTVIREDTDTATNTNVQSIAQSKIVDEVGKKNSTRISVMAGVAPTQTELFVYGVAVTKPVLGPVSIGVWGLSNKTFGASIGIDL